MTNQNSFGKSNTWPKRPVSGCQPGSVPLRNKILYQLDEVYANALGDGIYPSALKAVELNIKMLTYMESPAASLRVADLDTATIERMIIELGGDPSLDREPEPQAQAPRAQPQPQVIQPQPKSNIQVPKADLWDQTQTNHPQPQIPAPPLETPSAKMEQTTTFPASSIKEADLNKETIQNYIDDLGEEFAQELELNLMPQSQFYVPSKSLESSLIEEDQRNTAIYEEEQFHRNKPALFKQIQGNTLLYSPVPWLIKENAQPRIQSGEEQRNKPG